MYDRAYRGASLTTSWKKLKARALDEGYCQPDRATYRNRVRSNLAATFPRFNELALELRRSIVPFCGSREILNLAQTSHEMCDLALPFLYRHVDLSYHNDPGVYTCKGSESIVEGNHINREIPLWRVTDLAVQQAKFVKKILATPLLGAQVICLTWTYRQQDQHHEGVFDDDEDNLMWQAFNLMISLRTLDVFLLDMEGPNAPSNPLICTPSSIRLGGVMPYPFFCAFITKPENVVSLELDNLQGYGQVDDDEESSWSGKEYTLDIPETQDTDNKPLTRHPGPMRGHLYPYIGQFLNLKHFYYSTVGHDDSMDPLFSEERERKRYAEVANFISAARSTLKTIVFEQGLQPELRAGGWLPLFRGTEQVGRPMDSYFMLYVLPVLAKGSWPRLGAITVRGVGGLPRDPKVETVNNLNIGKWEPVDPRAYKNGKEMLQGAMQNATLVWETEATRSFAIEKGCDYTDKELLTGYDDRDKYSKSRLVVYDEWTRIY